ncbi:MAG TPA: class I SAM-dependent methyltransferase [Acidobacteriota bacterium]|nr:class I SAM-dependent methyltransferase [Acidobacteriota bacterium]
MTDLADYYGAGYAEFASDLYAAIRAEAFGEDIGQHSWLTAMEHDGFIEWLDVDAGSRLLDVACGSGGPTLRIASRSGCRVHGVDIEAAAVRSAIQQAEGAGLAARARFDACDAGEQLPFSDQQFDALICVDAVTHLPDRARVFRDWARVLRPGGRLVFTDAVTITGVLSDEEIRVRASIGNLFFAPPGLDEELLATAGFEVDRIEDRTENVATTAARRRSARAVREADLRRLEGDATFEGQQEFLAMATKLAVERRLSRFVFRCVRRRPDA